jgi:hypothetical protein
MHNYTIADSGNMTINQDTWIDDFNFLPYEEIKEKVKSTN